MQGVVWYQGTLPLMYDAGSCQPLSGLDVYVFIQLGGKCVFSMLLAYAGRILMAKEGPVHVARCQVMFLVPSLRPSDVPLCSVS